MFSADIFHTLKSSRARPSSFQAVNRRMALEEWTAALLTETVASVMYQQRRSEPVHGNESGLRIIRNSFNVSKTHFFES